MKDQGAILRRTIFDAASFAYVVSFLYIAFARPDSDVLVGNMGRNLQYFVGFSIFGAALSITVSARPAKTLGELIFAPPHRRRRDSEPRPLLRTFWGMQFLVILLVTLILGYYLADIGFTRLLDRDSLIQAGRVFAQLGTPDWSLLAKAIYKVIETVFIAFMATAIAVPIAFVLSFLTARNIMGVSKRGYFVYTVLRTFFNITRSVEPILWAIIFSIWVSFGPFAGMLALMVHSVASLAKQYSEIVESVEDGPIEGIAATGANKIQTIWFAIVPQIILPYLSYTIYRWDINVRSATILGFVGGGGIGTMLMEYQGQAKWHQVGCIIVVIAVVVWIMDAFSAHVRAAVK